MDSSEFFGGPDPVPSLDSGDKDGYGRYLLDATGTGKTPFTRATTIAKMLDNTNGLEIWTRRKVAKGVASSPALVARAAVTPLDDRQAWREILDQAEVKSGGDEKRDLGSAFHAFHEHVADMTDAEYAAVPHELRVTYERYRAELARLGITEVLTEFTCANTTIGVAGKGDAIFRLADGRLVIGDRKSGRITDYPHAACVQLATYANADVLIEYDENGATTRLPMPELDKTTALVVDITIGGEETAAVHVYELDIWSGWAAALLSVKIRAWRNRRDLVTPYHPDAFDPRGFLAGPPEIETTKVAQRVPVSRELVAETRATPEQRAEFAAELPPPRTAPPVEVAHGPAANVYTAPDATPHMREIQAKADDQRARAAMATARAESATHPAYSSADQTVIQLDAKGDRVPDDAPVLASQQVDIDALMTAFKTKAQLQAVLAKVDPDANLARTRANLAKDAVSHPNWPNVRAEFLPEDPAGVDYAAVQEAAEEFSPVVSNAPCPVPPDPEPQYNGVGTVEIERANPFAPPPDPEPAPVLELAEPIEDQLLRKIGEATSAADLAAVWQEANDAGIGWPARLHQAATIRQRHITSAPAAQ